MTQLFDGQIMVVQAVNLMQSSSRSRHLDAMFWLVYSNDSPLQARKGAKGLMAYHVHHCKGKPEV